MIPQQRRRHLQVAPGWAEHGRPAPADRAARVALRFLLLLGEKPLDVDELGALVSAESERSWNGFQGAAAWVHTLGDWIQGPICYGHTTDRMLAYLPIHRRLSGPTTTGGHFDAARPAAVITLLKTAPVRRWQPHGLTTL